MVLTFLPWESVLLPGCTTEKAVGDGYSVGVGRTDTPHCSLVLAPSRGLLDIPKERFLALLVEDEPHAGGWGFPRVGSGAGPMASLPRTQDQVTGHRLL